MTEIQTKVIAVVGPTASGKSALSIQLAEHFGTEVVSCDSMQIYRNMDIGTAKATKEERERVFHHMIDVADPSENWSLAEFTERAHAAIADIAARGKMPVLCGGTGLYLDHILFDTKLSDAPGDPAYRDSLEELTNEALHDKLAEVDPVSADAIHKNNRRRVIRALEIFHTTGKTKAEWDANSRIKTPRYDALIIGLYASDRSYLYHRIEDRVDQMMEMGLAQEVARLASSLGATAAQAIGYKEILRGLSGECDMEQAVTELKTATRRYAKRQMTWFGANPAICWLDICSLSREEILQKSIKMIEGFI